MKIIMGTVNAIATGNVISIQYTFTSDLQSVFNLKQKCSFIFAELNLFLQLYIFINISKINLILRRKNSIL